MGTASSFEYSLILTFCGIDLDHSKEGGPRGGHRKECELGISNRCCQDDLRECLLSLKLLQLGMRSCFYGN